ncbi:MAG: VWA domain-containing protein [Candidatus Hodarchaeota archaeon]
MKISEIIEDTVLVIDVSRSMARIDIEPSRFLAIKKALLKFAQKKLFMNRQNQIGVVTFGEKAYKELFFTADLSKIQETIKGLKISGSISYIGAGIAMAIQMHVDMLRQISGKISRMLVISDGSYSPHTAMDPIKMAKLAQGLGIQVDTINVGGTEDAQEILRQVSDLTGGEHLDISNLQILMNAIESLTANLSEETREALKSKKPLLSDLAGELINISEMSSTQKALVEKLSQTEREKCLICFKSDCGLCKQPFFACGRYCPNCGSPMHLHCAAQWAQSDTKSTTDKNVFRCPHCFYLLKVPASIAKVQDLREAIKLRKEYGSKGAETHETEMPESDLVNKVTPAEIGEDILTATCPVCDGIFEDDEEFLYECSNLDCSALYHKDCFEKLKKKDNYMCKLCNHFLMKFD